MTWSQLDVNFKKNKIKQRVAGFFGRMSTVPRSAGKSLTEPKDEECSRTAFLLELTGTWEQLEHLARYLRVMGNQTKEDLDIDEAEFQQLLDEMKDAINNLVQHNGYLPRQRGFSDQHRGFPQISHSWSLRTV